MNNINQNKLSCENNDEFFTSEDVLNKALICIEQGKNFI